MKKEEDNPSILSQSLSTWTHTLDNVGIDEIPCNDWENCYEKLFPFNIGFIFLNRSNNVIYS